MKIPVEELSVIVRPDGLVLATYARGAVLEQLLRPGMVVAALRALEAEERAGKDAAREDGMIGDRRLTTKRRNHKLEIANRKPFARSPYSRYL